MRAILTTPTPSLEESLDFFGKLGFARVVDEPPVFAEGETLIEIDGDRFARPGVKLYRDDWQPVLDALDGEVRLHETDTGWLLTDPSGVFVRLMRGECPYPLLEGEKAEQRSAFGAFAGLSLESGDLERSVGLWRRLGFEPGEQQGDAWVTCTGYGLGISIMKPLTCPHLFFNPSLTYFNSGKNPEIIAELRKRGVSFAEEITHFNDQGIVDNVIVRDPGGWGIFVFND